MLSCLHVETEVTPCNMGCGCWVASWKLPMLHSVLCWSYYLGLHIQQEPLATPALPQLSDMLQLNECCCAGIAQRMQMFPSSRQHAAAVVGVQAQDPSPQQPDSPPHRVRPAGG